MISLLYFLFMVLSTFFIYKVRLIILQKIFPFARKNDLVPLLNHLVPASSSGSCKYDVFLSFRGEDTRKKFVDHLYTTLKESLIRVYKDDEALPRGESINQSLFEAIEESRIAVIIFSKNYAGSSWCLDELTHIMKCKDERGLMVIPIFYDVEPTEVRNQKGRFGEAFAKLVVKKNATKVEIWRKVLADVSNIAGWEPKNIANGHESQFIKKIVDTILDRLLPLNSCVDEDLVGMKTRFQDLKSLLDFSSGGVRMVGIWGVGGGGKTTLATSAYMNISQHFQGHCIIENVREEVSKHGLKKLQENILSALFKEEMKVHSVSEGKEKMKSMLRNRSVLVVLDDVDKLDQLEALAGKHSWFGSGSRIIITTRDEHLLRTHKVDNVYPIQLLSHDEATLLFKRHAYNEEDPVDDYESLSKSVVSYCAGLPLAIKVLGSFLYDKNKTQWKSTMEKLKNIPDPEVMDILKISFGGLETYQKDLFLDIACFWRFKEQGDAMMELLDACGYHPEIGIKVLLQKALITIDVKGRFDMHDLVQEMGHYIVRGEHPDNPEKHSRLWKHKEIEDMPFHDQTLVKEYDKTIEAIYYHNRYEDYDSSRLCKIVSKMKKLRLLDVSGYVDTESDSYKNAEGANFLSNELRYIKWSYYPATPFPHSFQPVKLVVLRLDGSLQKEIWKGYKHLPCLRELELRNMKKLLSTPNFDGLPLLQKLILHDCEELEEIHPSLRSHTSLEWLNVSFCKKLKRIPILSQMKNIKTLIIKRCSLKDGEIPRGIGELSNLQELDLSGNSFSRVDFSLAQLSRLKCLKLADCDNLLELPELPSSLAILIAHDCKSLIIVEDFSKDCKELCHVSLDKRGWSDIVLRSMLKGNAIANGCMYLKLKGLEIPDGFERHLLRGRSSCKLELPENWINDFSGFLLCIITSDILLDGFGLRIAMKQVSGDSDFFINSLAASRRIRVPQVLSDTDFEDDVVWEESDSDGDGDEKTFVWYVSFGSFRETTWWDQTYESLFFYNKLSQFIKCNGFGVRLVEKKTTNGGQAATSTNSSSYTPKFKIKHDSPVGLMVELKPYQTLTI